MQKNPDYAKALEIFNNISYNANKEVIYYDCCSKPHYS